MAEYKLSYTAEEINEKLGQVGAPISYNDLTDKPSIVTRSEIKSPATQGTYASLYEKPFGDIPTPLREKESMFSLHPQGLNVYQSVETFEIAEIIAGETYKVKWDDTEYTCVAKTQNKIGEAVIENVNLGNATKLFGQGLGEDTGEPFFIYFDKGYYDKIYIQTDSTEERHTVAITPVNSIKKIDAKYLPEGIGSSGGNATVKETILSEQLINNFAPDEDFYGLYSAGTIIFTPIELGETYTVVWDEKTYSCLTQDVSSLLEEGSIAMGNGSSFGFPGNNEPFIIAVTPFDGAYIYAFLAVDGSMSSSHSVSIYKEKGKDVIKPDVLPVNIPNDLFVEDEEKKWIEILPAITKEFFLTSIGDSPNFFGTIIESDENTATKWQNYTGKVKVIWDGIPYECEMQTVMGGNAVGNLVAFGGTGNDEPFAAVCLSDNGGNAWILGSLVDTSAQSHTCQIFLLEESKTIVINNDYLNFIEKSNGDEIEIVPEQTITLEQDADLKFKYVAHPGTELYNQLYQVEIGKTYKILWDNAIYTCIAKDASWAVPSDAGEKRKAVTLGNVTLLEDYPLTDSSSNTGEPFVLAIGDYDILSDSISYGMFISPIPNAIETLYDIQFSISQILDKVKIKRDYLPEIPTFDLIGMGMPAIDVTLNNTMRTFECDTTEIMTAAAKGTIKLKIALNVTGLGETIYEIFELCSYAPQLNSYGFTELFELNSIIIAFSCSINESGIFIHMLPLATATT